MPTKVRLRSRPAPAAAVVNGSFQPRSIIKPSRIKPAPTTTETYFALSCTWRDETRDRADGEEHGNETGGRCRADDERTLHAGPLTIGAGSLALEAEEIHQIGGQHDEPARVDCREHADQKAVGKVPSSAITQAQPLSRRRPARARFEGSRRRPHRARPGRHRSA